MPSGQDMVQETSTGDARPLRHPHREDPPVPTGWTAARPGGGVLDLGAGDACLLLLERAVAPERRGATAGGLASGLRTWFRK